VVKEEQTMAYFAKSGIGTLAVGMLVFGASLMGSPALAKSHCKGNCRAALAHEMIACKKACATITTAGKSTHRKLVTACRKTCSTDHVADLQACKAAANPTPPGCSPSGAFLD
jgi:hypothetical protein